MCLQTDLVPSEDYRGESVSSSLLNFWRLPIVFGSWPLPSFLQHISLASDSTIKPFLTLANMSSPCKEACDYIGTIWVMQVNFPSQDTLISYICKVASFAI